MALDARKRQQKLAKKTAKRKAALVTRSGPGQGNVARVQPRQVALAAQSPVHECLTIDKLFELGIGPVILSRALPNARIGAAFFLLDVYCLGVKNAFFAVMSPAEYREQVLNTPGGRLLKITPACGRKLVEAAEAYARNLGFSPHPDYRLAHSIFGEIDATACLEQFTFGKDGKPFFVSGPSDTPARCQRIIQTLTQRCGPDGFHYLAGMGGSFDMFDDEDEDDEV